jgi:hypothetical protein
MLYTNISFQLSGLRTIPSFKYICEQSYHYRAVKSILTVWCMLRHDSCSYLELFKYISRQHCLNWIRISWFLKFIFRVSLRRIATYYIYLCWMHQIRKNVQDTFIRNIFSGLFTQVPSQRRVTGAFHTLPFILNLACGRCQPASASAVAGRACQQTVWGRPLVWENLAEILSGLNRPIEHAQTCILSLTFYYNVISTVTLVLRLRSTVQSA